MSCETIKFKVTQDKISKTLKIETYRPYGINDEWMRIDISQEITVQELKYLTEYLISIFKKSK